MTDHRFTCTDPIRVGPYATEAEAQQGQHDTFVRWRDRARALGGTALRLTAKVWVVSLPDGVPCPGLPLRTEPIGTLRVPK